MNPPECLPDSDPNDHFDPESRRNPKVPAIPVILADGRTWHFACATDRYRPEFIGDVCVGAVAYRGFPASCQPAMDALIRGAQGPTDVPVSVVLRAAATLLRKAHNLSAGEAAALLHVGESDLTEVIRGLSAACWGETEAAAEAEPEADPEPEGGAE